MDYVYFGKTGIRVSTLCLGTMTFGKEADEPTSIAIMERALEAGINFFDSANIYVAGKTEEIVGRWIKSHREQIVLTSKVHFPFGEGINDRGSSRRNILMSVDQSLKRLNTDWLDILYLHHWDANTAIEESLAAMTTLVEQGKVMYCGVSNFSAWQTMKAISVSQANGFAPITCIQPMYNLVKRQAEVELLPLALSEHLAVCPYSPQGGGLLTGKYRRGEGGRLAENAMYKERYKNVEYAEVTERFLDYVDTHKRSASATAIAWVMSHPAVTSTIIGARNMDQFNEALQCLEKPLSPEEYAAITALSIEPPLATDRDKS